MRECVEILCNVGHDGPFVRSHVANVFNIKKGLISAMSSGDIPQSQSFQRQRMQVQSSDDGYVVVMYCIAVNLDGTDQLMRNYIRGRTTWEIQSKSIRPTLSSA
jgi:hypothetical protein